MDNKNTAKLKLINIKIFNTIVQSFIIFFLILHILKFDIEILIFFELEEACVVY